MFSRILKNYERSEKSDTVLLDEIKEGVLHEDFDRTSESSVSIVIYVSRAIAELFEMKSVRKRLNMGDKKVRTRVFQCLRKRTETLTQKKALGAICTQMLNSSPNPGGVLSSIRQTR